MQDRHQDAEYAGGGRLLTTRDVQQLIRVDRSTVYRMAESGRLPAVKVGRQWRFPENRFREWLERGRVDAAGPREVVLRDLVPRPQVLALTELVGELLGVMVLVTDMSGRPLAEPGHPCPLFTAAHAHPGVLDRCMAEWREMANEPDLEPRWRPTPLGFLCARALIRVGDHLPGMILAGGVAPPDWPTVRSRLADLATDLGIPADVLLGQADGVYHLSAEEQERVLRLLPRVAAFLSRLAAGTESLIGPSGRETLPSSSQKQRSIQ